MRMLCRLSVLLLFLASCGKNSDSEPVPVYTTVDGIWTYTTPDKAVSVEFELKTTGSVVEILNATIKVGNVEGEAAGTVTGVDLPVIDQIRINANDAVLVTNYSITFMNCSVSSNFVFITA